MKIAAKNAKGREGKKVKKQQNENNVAKCKEAWYNDCPHMKSFVGVQGAVFQKSPLVAEGKK